eukprot:4557101-Pyramimonas_sp.AAC.1
MVSSRGGPSLAASRRPTSGADAKYSSHVLAKSVCGQTGCREVHGHFQGGCVYGPRGRCVRGGA